MRPRSDTLDLIADLKARNEPFVLATVVRTVSVTAAKAGAKAVIRSDGTITEGWIGGGCARAAVLKAAREAIADGEPRLISIQPKDLLDEQGLKPGEVREGVRFARNMCPSRGTMDVFVEPMLPSPALAVFGASPVAVALAELAPRFGLRVTVCAPAEDQGVFAEAAQRIEGYALDVESEGQRFVVVSTQGRGDEAALRAALSVRADHVAFVGSRRKVASLRAHLIEGGVAPECFDRLKAPAGLDIGAVTPDEIALSILAEILAVRRRDHRTPSEAASH
ncbi:XdhC family protein [Labrys monachus]|uniref:Xanthine dehydrogenase accessory factor n=1 Tax=Labrys monachus TaxID=217067 RepID=A0ABU0FAE2_9HYPH|nr:XdhC/CoxI family protein [Labrys monachus]MDQ0391023.1 xanthine dehydrogenase accessory factor [Labrys monachus]